MVKHFNDVLTSSPLPFLQAPRMIVHRCQRFLTFKPPGPNGWGYSSKCFQEAISVTGSKPIMLHGIQHFGSEGGRYTVSTEVRDGTDSSSLVNQSGSYVSEKDDTYDYYGFDVRFDRPVCLEEKKEYHLVSSINGPKSWYGADGQMSVESQGIRFIFHSCAGYDASYRSYQKKGQLPALLLA